MLFMLYVGFLFPQFKRGTSTKEFICDHATYVFFLFLGFAKSRQFFLWIVKKEHFLLPSFRDNL